MRAHFDDRHAGERGFILVGVVTFMLALTILGLSLFALSSFEAQFFTTAVAREQSLHNAESGMELAKVLLSQSPSPQRLEAVRLAVGQFGVTSALAYQQRSELVILDDTTSQGPIDWDKPVTLVVSARFGGVERQLEAQYRPGDNPYRRLLTSGTGVQVVNDNDAPRSAIELRGGVWHPVASETDTAWTTKLTWPEGRPVQTNRPPLPQADAFVDAHFTDPETTAPPLPFDEEKNRFTWTLESPAGGVKYFKSPPSPCLGGGDCAAYSFHVDRALTINIRGTVVWVVPGGVSFWEKVRIVGQGVEPSTLVIVAKRGQDVQHPDRAIAFKGGLRLANPEARLYLVSEGGIALRHENNEYDDQDAVQLSVVAGGRIELSGPEGGHRFRLTYSAEEMDALADQLLSQGALPLPADGASTTFQLVRSSWIESTPR